jgi:aminotransferase
MTSTREGSERFIGERARNVPPSGIRRFFDILSTVEDVISLGVGEPDYVTPEPVRRAAVESIERGDTHYTSNFGLLELRERLSQHIHDLYGVRYDPANEIIITSGSSEGLDIAVRATIDPGDGLLCADPGYVAYRPITELAGGQFQTVLTCAGDAFRLRERALERAIQPNTRALLMGYPSNPTGAVMERPYLEEVASFAERHDMLVISDELYDRISYGFEHTCFASLPGMKERTILLGGWSKAYAMTGWRLGWVAGPAPLVEATMRIHQYTMMSAPTAAQYAGLAALDLGEPFVLDMVAEYDRRRGLIVDGLRAVGLDTFEPRGAFYAFPDITVTGMSSWDFSERLMAEERVAVVPGSAFGEGGEGFVRACYANSYEAIEQALERIGRFVQRHR